MEVNELSHDSGGCGLWGAFCGLGGAVLFGGNEKADGREAGAERAFLWHITPRVMPA